MTSPATASITPPPVAAPPPVALPPVALPTIPCAVCCHETRNAMAAVTYFARQVQRHHPGLAPGLLAAALARLDKQLARCGGATIHKETA